MQVLELKELVLAAKGVSEQDVRDVGEVIRQVEELGGVRAKYNLAAPFSRTPKPAGPRPVLKKQPR